MGTLDDKTALITGGGRGIGRGISLELAKEGSDIVIADLDLENAEKTASDIEDLNRMATVVEMDVADEKSVSAGLEAALAEHDRIDILVNNAGVVGKHVGGAVDLDDWDTCYSVNQRNLDCQQRTRESLRGQWRRKNRQHRIDRGTKGFSRAATLRSLESGRHQPDAVVGFLPRPAQHQRKRGLSGPLVDKYVAGTGVNVRRGRN